MTEATIQGGGMSVIQMSNLFQISDNKNNTVTDTLSICYPPGTVLHILHILHPHSKPVRQDLLLSHLMVEEKRHREAK